MGNGNGHLREFGKFRLDAVRQVLWFGHEPVKLALKEIEILCVLTENGGQVVTKDEIISRVWADSFVEESNLSRHIYLIRKTFKDHGESGDLITTVPRRGYRFNADVTEVEQNSGQNGAGVGGSVEPVENASVFKNYRFIAVAAVVMMSIIVAVAAWQLNSGSAKNTETLAVIPFSSVEGGEKSEFNILLADSLIRNLGKIKTIEVVPLKSVREFAGQDIDATSAAGSLGADLVLTGDYSVGADKIRTHVTLRRLSDNTTLLDETFELGKPENIDLETAVALRASKLLSEKLPRNDEAHIDKTDINPEAIDNYLIGREIWRQQTFDRKKEMQQHFERAIELAPDWSPAYSALAEALLSPNRGAIDFENAEANARKALELDLNNAGANVALAQVCYTRLRDWVTAESYFEKALDSDPNYAAGYHAAARFLMYQGKFVRARQMMDKAIELEPFQAIYFDRLAEISYYERKTTEALVNCDIALSLNPIFSIGKRLHAIYVLEKRYLKLAELYSKGSSDNAILRQLLTKGSENADLSEYWQYSIELSKVRPDTQYRQLAHYYMQLNKHEEALDALEKSLEQYDYHLLIINIDPVYDPIRNHARFKAVIEKLGL